MLQKKDEQRTVKLEQKMTEVTNADVTTSSSHNAKPNVGSSVSTVNNFKFDNIITRQITYSDNPKYVENLKTLMDTFSVKDYEINYDTNTFSILKKELLFAVASAF